MNYSVKGYVHVREIWKKNCDRCVKMHGFFRSLSFIAQNVIIWFIRPSLLHL